MNTAAWLTRGTIWMAMLCYLAVVLEQARVRRSTNFTRGAWTLGCVLTLAHLAAAFHFYHQWSHALAWEDTRRQTLEQTGFNFGGGIWFNYLFAALWLIDCAGWLAGGKLLSERSKIWFVTLHAFFLFMIFNATVVFGHGWARPAGALICAVVPIVMVGRARAFRA